MLKYIPKITFFCLFFIAACAFSDEIEEYQVNFIGTEDPEILQTLQDNSKLVELQNRPPKTELALKHRSEEDIPISSNPSTA